MGKFNNLSSELSRAVSENRIEDMLLLFAKLKAMERKIPTRTSPYGNYHPEKNRYKQL
jgi:hypothetical protein